MKATEFVAALELRDLSQAAFARFLGIAPSTVSRWITGQVECPPYLPLLFVAYDELRPHIDVRSDPP